MATEAELMELHKTVENESENVSKLEIALNEARQKIIELEKIYQEKSAAVLSTPQREAATAAKESLLNRKAAEKTAAEIQTQLTAQQEKLAAAKQAFAKALAINEAEEAAKVAVLPVAPPVDPSSPPAAAPPVTVTPVVAATAATTPDPATAPKPTVVAVPLANATATYTFDPEKIDQGGIYKSACTIAPAVGNKAVPKERQTEIKDMIAKIELETFRNFINKSTNYKIENHKIVNKKDGSSINEDQMKQIRADYMKDGRTDENLNKTAKEVLATEGKNFTLNFKTAPPIPAAAPTVYDVVAPAAAVAPTTPAK